MSVLGLYRITSLLVLVCRRDRSETINELVERIELSPKFDYGILRVQDDVVQRAGRVFSVCIVSVDMSAPMAETCEDWKKKHDLPILCPLPRVRSSYSDGSVNGL